MVNVSMESLQDMIARTMASQLSGLTGQLDEFRTEIKSDIQAVQSQCTGAVLLATSATAAVSQLRSEVEEHKYDPYQVLLRSKVMVAGAVKLDLTPQQRSSWRQRAAAAEQALQEALKNCRALVEIKGDTEWELLDVDAWEIRRGRNAGKYNVVFSVLKLDDAAILLGNRSALFTEKQLSLRVWLSNAEMRNKKTVWECKAFQAAVQQVREKPRGTRGYTMGWDLDRAFTVIAGKRQYWTAASVQQQEEATAGAAAPAGGAGTSGAAAMEH